jgi:pre-mycofactocin synthase
VYSALLAASEKGVTAADNVEAFSELGLAPHVIGTTEKRDLSATALGQQISLPVVMSPTGVQAVHPDGGGAGRGRARHRDGTVVVCQQADRRGDRGQRHALLPGLFGSVTARPSRSACAARGRPAPSD